jgi:hypothetical protein
VSYLGVYQFVVRGKTRGPKFTLKNWGCIVEKWESPHQKKWDSICKWWANFETNLFASSFNGAGIKIPKKCNFSPFGLPFPSPKLHHDAKKKMQKMCNFWQKPKMHKMQKMQVAFSPLPF